MKGGIGDGNTEKEKNHGLIEKELLFLKQKRAEKEEITSLNIFID